MLTWFTIRNCIALTAISLGSVVAEAAPPSFQITRLFSNLDGTYQFVQLQVVVPPGDEPELAAFLKTWTPRKESDPRERS